METGRLSFVLLVIALANLATDITRLALELAPPPAPHDSVPVQTRPSQQEISIQSPDARADATQRDIPQQKAKLPDAPGARGPPREPIPACQSAVFGTAPGFQRQSPSVVLGLSTDGSIC